MKQDVQNPIGVFDSGVGGLTVVRALMERLPFENIIYFGDTARVPYGVKSVETICRFACEITDFLLKSGVKILIVACNTMAAVAREVITGLSSVPVLNVIEAGASAAVSATRRKYIGVIGTPATINSNAYARAIHQLDPAVRIYSQACPLFVPLVEEGWLDHPVTRLTAMEYLKPVTCHKIDTLVLGCTHYPLLKPMLQELVGRRNPACGLGRGDGRTDRPDPRADGSAEPSENRPRIPLLRIGRATPVPVDRGAFPGPLAS